MRYPKESVKRAFGKEKNKMRIIKRKTTNDVIFDIINSIILTIVGLIALYPLILFERIGQQPDPVRNGEVWLLPKGTTMEGCARIFKDSDLWRGYLSSIIYTALAIGIGVPPAILAAYLLSRKDFKARNILMGIYTFTMSF